MNYPLGLIQCNFQIVFYVMYESNFLGSGNYVCYTSTKSWRGYIFTSVCLCVCLSVCLSVCLCVRYFLVNKIPAERMNRFGRGFRLMVAYRIG